MQGNRGKKGLGRHFIPPKLYHKIERGDSKIEERVNARERFVYECFTQGGAPFVERVAKYARTEKGEPIIMYPWYRELLLMVGDFRFPVAITTGCSQNGKTMAHTLLVVDALVFGKLNVGWFYDSLNSMTRNQPSQFRPIADLWVDKVQLDWYEQGYRSISTKRDRRMVGVYSFDGATTNFTYVSTTRGGRSERAAAGSAIVSFQADFIVLDEYSQYPEGAADPTISRMGASCLPTKPRRPLGTPGGGMGIEREAKDADLYFYPHAHCQSCGELVELNPKGCLLKEFEREDATGKNIRTYFSESGRPQYWYHHDPYDPIDTAYFACPHCDAELTTETRVNGKFRCINTGQWLEDVIRNTPPNTVSGASKVVLHLTPVTRDDPLLAAQLIRNGLTAFDPADWQQQGLGFASEIDLLQVRRSMIEAGMRAPIPSGQPRFTVAGIDMGRSGDWLWIHRVYYPEELDSTPKKLRPSLVLERSVREVIFCQQVNRNDIPYLLQEYNVTFGLIDNEPSRESAMQICRGSVLQMADQIGGLMQPIRETMVVDGGIKYPCWQIRNERFLLSVFHGFSITLDDGFPLYRFPGTLDRWVADVTELSPFRHLTAPYRDAMGIWHRGDRNVDDLYYSAMFAEAATYLMIEYGTPKPTFGRIKT